MTNKEFAEKNAGKYFLYRGLKVRVAGYQTINGLILVSTPEGPRGFGWSAQVLDGDDVFVTSSNASKYWYADKESLTEWIRK